MIEFAIMWLPLWFGIGVFVALVNLIQWYFDGALIGEGTEDPYYHLMGMLQNVFFGFVFGPAVLFIQITRGMPILPVRKK